jgi:hypothetical protein
MRRTPNGFDANFALQVFNLPQSSTYYLLNRLGQTWVLRGRQQAAKYRPQRNGNASVEPLSIDEVPAWQRK